MHLGIRYNHTENEADERRKGPKGEPSVTSEKEKGRKRTNKGDWEGMAKRRKTKKIWYHGSGKEKFIFLKRRF